MSIDDVLRTFTRQAGQGACTCGPAVLYPDCRCEWGSLIKEAIQQAYYEAPEDRLRHAESRTGRWQAAIKADRINALVALADRLHAFGGLAGIARSVGVSMGNMSKLAKQAREAGKL
jgi:hypothetical protein